MEEKNQFQAEQREVELASGEPIIVAGFKDRRGDFLERHSSGVIVKISDGRPVDFFTRGHDGVYRNEPVAHYI